jgi:hypothetical protein
VCVYKSMLIIWTIITALTLATTTITIVDSFAIPQQALAEPINNGQQQQEEEEDESIATRQADKEKISLVSTSENERENGNNNNNDDDDDDINVASSTNYEEGEQQCREGNVLEDVYDPGRLNVLSSCEEVIGIVEDSGRAHDGDYKMYLEVENGYKNLLNEENDAKTDGLLVIEIIPEDQDSSMVEIPKDGDRVRVVGAWVTDEGAGGWNEIHPAWIVEILE